MLNNQLITHPCDNPADITAHAATQSKPQRLEFIDLAKGICILLVISLHSNYFIGGGIVQSLAMPLYFAISGMFFKNYNNFQLLIINKFNKIILPYCFFFGFGIAINLAISILFNEEIHLRLFTFFEGIVISPNIAIWFMRTLFIDCLLYYIICSLTKNNMARFLFCIFLGFCGYLLFLQHLFLPWHFSVSLTSMPFFGFGHLLQTHKLFKILERWQYIRIFVVSLMVPLLGISVYTKIPQIHWIDNMYEGIEPLCHLVSIVLITGFLLFLQSIGKIPGVSYIGRYSIIPFGVHFPIMILTCKVLSIYDLSSNHALIFAVTLAISVALIPVFTRLFPHFTAQKDLIHINPEGAGFFRRIKFAM